MEKVIAMPRRDSPPSGTRTIRLLIGRKAYILQINACIQPEAPKRGSVTEMPSTTAREKPDGAT